MDNKNSTILNLEQQEQVKRYFELLQRVSTRKATSANLSVSCEASGFIDTIELKPKVPIFMDHLRNPKIYGSVQRPTKLKDKGFYQQIFPPGHEDQSIFLRQGFNNTATKVIFHPQRFLSAKKLLDKLTAVIQPYEPADLMISRMDLTCDYAMSFDKLMRGIEVPFKQVKTEFVQGGSQITGSYFGKGQEQIILYDKALQQNAQEPRSRIEVRLSGKKLPIKNLNEILNGKLLDRIAANNPMARIKLFDLSVPEFLLNTEQGARFKTLLDAQGYQSAKRHLNTANNFDRDIGRLLFKTMYNRQPGAVLQEGLAEFIEG